MTRWRYGDGPVWGDGQMGSVYGSAGITIDSTKGTVNIAIRTCTDDIVENVSVSLEPAPERLAYVDAGGFASTTLTATVGPYTSAIGFNAPAGPTRVRATSTDGLVFADLVIDVQPGSNITYPVLHPSN